MRVRILLAAGALLATWTLVPRALAQDKKDDNPFASLPKPGPEHKMLAELGGTFEAKIKAWMDPKKKEPMESTGTLTRKMILDGRYLQETFIGEFAGMKFKGQGILAYDTPKKKYHMVWVDNFGLGVYLAEGTYDTSTKSYIMRGEEEMPEVGKMKTKDVLKVISKDEQVFEAYRQPAAGGPEFKVMEITYIRKPPAKKTTK